MSECDHPFCGHRCWLDVVDMKKCPRCDQELTYAAGVGPLCPTHFDDMEDKR